jgi:signal transduction histidine kinase
MILRLQARYSLIVFAILAAIIVAMTAVHLMGFRSTLETSADASSQAVTKALLQKNRQQGEDRARLLADMLADQVFRLQVDRIEAHLVAVAKQEGTEYVVVRDDKGRVISALDKRGISKVTPLTGEDIRRALATGKVASVSDGPILHLVAPIRIGRRNLGYVRIGVSLKAARAEVAAIGHFMELVSEKTQRYFVVLYILIAVIIVCIGLGFGLVMVRGIARPIRALSRYTRRIGAGNYDDPPKIDRTDELGDLANDLQTMARNLKQVGQVSRLAILGEMTVGVAHELNQPLNTVRLAADNALLSREQGDLDPSFTDAKLRLISDQAANMGEIIQRMCVIGGGAGAQTTIDVRESIRDAYSLLGGQYEDDGIQVALNIPDAAMPVLGRRNELAQVIINLLSNAKDAINSSVPPGSANGLDRVDRGMISVDVTTQENDLVISVADNGIGIAPELMGRIFDPFFTTKEATKGTGLGLSISFGIIDSMGGRLSAESNPDGSVFTICLPRDEGAVS